MKQKLFTIIIILILSFAHRAFAQEIIQIYGSIHNKNNQPITDASIVFKDGRSSSRSDAKGRFIIALKFDIDTLIITHAGFRPLTKIVNPKTTYPIDLLMIPVHKK